MIYFDSAVKKALVERFISRLAKGDYLPVGGHSENLIEFGEGLDSRQYGVYSKK